MKAKCVRAEQVDDRHSQITEALDSLLLNLNSSLLVKWRFFNE